MTDEQLIFQAADAIYRARLFLGELWAPPGPSRPGTLDRNKCAHLLGKARDLACVAQELERRAAGAPRPKQDK